MSVLWQKVVREEAYEILGFLQEGNSLGKYDFHLKYTFCDADKMK